MKGWLGWSEVNGKFKAIIDLYNTQKPLPVGYKMKYTDEWCAATVTAAGMQAGLSDIILGECSCSRMIALYKAKGRWMEDDAYRPDIRGHPHVLLEGRGQLCHHRPDRQSQPCGLCRGGQQQHHDHL